MLGFIGGSGFYDIGERIKEHEVETPYGNAMVQECELLGNRFLFISRHGKGHKMAPHKINYRANVAALQKMNASSVLCVYATGAISDYNPGELVLLEDFLSFWMGPTFYDDFSGGIRHVDFTEPFDNGMKEILLETAATKGLTLKKNGIVATTRGPRFETKAEIRALKTLGANLVSMTCGHELPLLGEAEIPHAGIAIATNHACGVSGKPLSESEVFDALEKCKGDVVSLLEGVLENAG